MEFDCCGFVVSEVVPLGLATWLGSTNVVKDGSSNVSDFPDSCLSAGAACRTFKSDLPASVDASEPVDGKVSTSVTAGASDIIEITV